MIPPAFHLPPTVSGEDEESLNLLLERAYLIESHTSKRFETLRTQLGVGFAILIGLVAAIITTAGTLFKGGLTSHPLLSIIGGLELACIVSSFLAFRKAYRQLSEDVGPDIRDSEKMNAFIRTKPIYAKALLFKIIQSNVKENLESQMQSAISVDIGFFFLAISIFATFIHAVISGMITS